MQNYPNPASEFTYFPYNITRRAQVSIELIGINGMIKTILKDKRKRAGLHIEKIDLSGMASGIYFIRFTSSAEGIKNHTVCGSEKIKMID